ncbi:MAG: CRISPR-associated protein Csx20 [Candidatus Vecturithrix sp.]|nr:CRISPR-associated protein Csx20 [Candidatus Vecturithrix sp.]
MPASRLFLLFSHALTAEQAYDARAALQVQDILSLPKDLQQRWSNVPPDLETIGDHLRPVLDWLNEQARPGDYVLIQGDFGAVYRAVRFALEHGLTPLYATTTRRVKETRLPNGQVESHRVFQHVRYRKYE